MVHQSFCQIEDLLSDFDPFTAAYAHFRQSGNVPTSLAEDVQHLEAAQ